MNEDEPTETNAGRAGTAGAFAGHPGSQRDARKRPGAHTAEDAGAARPGGGSGDFRRPRPEPGSHAAAAEGHSTARVDVRPPTGAHAAPGAGRPAGHSAARRSGGSHSPQRPRFQPQPQAPGSRVRGEGFSVGGSATTSMAVDRLAAGGLVGASAFETVTYKPQHLRVSVMPELQESMGRIEAKFEAGTYDAQVMPLVRQFLDSLEELARIQVERNQIDAMRVNDIKEANAKAFEAVCKERELRESGIEALRLARLDALAPDPEKLEAARAKRAKRDGRRQALTEARERRRLEAKEEHARKTQAKADERRRAREEREERRRKQQERKEAQRTAREDARAREAQAKADEAAAKRQLRVEENRRKSEELRRRQEEADAESRARQARSDAEAEKARAEALDAQAASRKSELEALETQGRIDRIATKGAPDADGKASDERVDAAQTEAAAEAGQALGGAGDSRRSDVEHPDAGESRPAGADRPQVDSPDEGPQGLKAARAGDTAAEEAEASSAQSDAAGPDANDDVAVSTSKPDLETPEGAEPSASAR